MTTTDGQKSNPGSADDWAIGITRSLNDQRARAQAFLKRQRERRAQQKAPGADGPGPHDVRHGDLTDADLATMAGRLMTEVEQLRVELSHARKRTRADAAGSDSSATCGEPVTTDSALLAELDELRAERQQLSDRLAESEKNSGGDSESEPADQRHEDLRRRFEMAVEDVRELKACNSELEEKLRQGGGGKPAAVASGGADGALDWEAQKERLLAQLDDFDDDDEEEVRDKLTVDGAIRITDQVVAEKEKEIAEFKAQLENRPVVHDRQPGASDVLDNDEAIQTERAKLLALQEDWKEKLRKAEIEISVEKAKLAREKTQLEEQLHTYEARLAEQGSGDAASSDSDKPKKSGGRRWLSRLGLTDDD